MRPVPLSVLTDQHHAGLLRSIQLLGERLGWAVHVPVGPEWWDAGVWRFGSDHLGAQLRDQYLVPDSKWRHVTGGLWVMRDPEFPDVPIAGVELATARRMRWDVVMPTLQDNQRGYHAFAKGVGARYACQVGNTAQHVDWSLDPLALVSSEVPILGRGVRYHQEMAPEASTFRDPAEADRRTVRSFVNCFGSTGCAPLLGAFREGVNGGWTFAVHGIDGPAGVSKPIGATADLMAGSGFGWHDKEQGDGYGHVVHMWAAVGRPLIGHAGHYRGRLAEHLWRHGETCIDLDRVTVPEAVAMAEAIAADPGRHAAMCRAVRAEYARIDHAAEAESIRALLALPGGEP